MKNLRRLALARIHADVTFSRQHWTASGGWRRRIMRAIAQYFILPISLICIGAVITTLGAVIGDGINRAPIAIFLLSVAGISVVIAFSHAGWVLRELIGSRSLAVASVLPDSDIDYLSGRLRSSLIKSLAFLVGSLLLGAGIAPGAELNVFDTIQILLLSLLLWAMVASLSVIVPAFLPMIIRQEVTSSIISLLMLMFMCAAVLVTVGIAAQGTLVSAALISLPTGWPVLMIKYGVILKQPEFWWLLAPAGCVVVAAVVGHSRLLSRYRIQEFNYEPGALASAEFRSIANRESLDTVSPDEFNQMSPAETTTWLREAQRRLNRWLKPSDVDEPADELTRNQAIARIREAGLTRRFDWSEAGFIERTAARLLKDDELLSAEILSGGQPRWSQSMARALVPATAVVTLVVIIAFFVHRQFAVICGHVGLAGLAGALAGSRWAWLWRSDSGDVCAALSLLPVDDRHVSRAVMTLGAIRSALIFPFTLVVIAAVTWGHRGRFELVDSVMLCAKVSLIIAAIHQWWFLLGLPCTWSQTIRKNIQDIIVAIAIVCTMITGVCLLLMSGRSEIEATIGAGLMFGTGWAAQQIQRHNILKSPTDFVMNRTAQLATAQRQRKNRQTGKIPTFWPRPVEPAELRP